MNSPFTFLAFLGNEAALNVILIISLIWSTAWKGLALWNAALNKQLYWFVAFLVLNTLGILEIVYLFRFAKKRLTVQKLLELLKIRQ